LADGSLELAGTPIRLSAVKAEVFTVGAKDDHIAPWSSVYTGARLLGGPTRFVLTSSGHVAGIVNPPGPKRSYWARADNPDDPVEWLDGAAEHAGSWWEEWARWIGDRAGERGQPPSLGSEAHPPLGAAPGTYVLEE
jgi:poly[(R)-3-hydroxyalkanoate] polymerase subunit PhaC